MKGPRFWFLLVLFAATAFGLNILPNPSFELWLGNTPVGWLTSELLWPGTAVKDSNCHSGTYCVKLAGGDTSAFASSATIVRSGFSYEFSGYARVPGALGGSFVLQFLSLTGGAIGTPTLLPAYYSGSNYREYSRWVTAPDSATFLSVSLATLPNVTVYLDDVTVDDTTLSAVNEGTISDVKRARYQPRKVVRLGRNIGRLEPGAVLFDPLGRRLARPAGPGVYFVPPGR
jgi:hypothetical protein